jgi:hypothetical protein
LGQDRGSPRYKRIQIICDSSPPVQNSEEPGLYSSQIGLIGLQTTDFSHIEHKDHKGLAKVNPVLDSPIILWCGLCVLCVLCGLWLFAESFG